MDMYRILENFDAVNSKQTLAEGSMKRYLHALAEKMSKEDFVAKADEHGMSAKEAAEFWNTCRGEDDKELNEGLSPKIKKIIKAYRKLYPKIAYDADGEDLMEPEEAHDETCSRLGVDPSDMDEYFELEDEELEEGDMEEGNKFAHNVLKAKAARMKKADLDGDGEMETVREDDDEMNEATKSKDKEKKPPFPGSPEYEKKHGKFRHDDDSAFHKKKVSTGTVYSRKHKEEPEADDEEDKKPKKSGRPTGTKKKIGAKGPSTTSKLLTGKNKGGLKEHDHEHDHEMHMHSSSDSGEYDDEAGMARQDLHTVVDAAKELHDILASDENLPEWVQAKITKALDYIDTSRDYIKSSHADQGEQRPVPEASDDQLDQQKMAQMKRAAATRTNSRRVQQQPPQGGPRRSDIPAGIRRARGDAPLGRDEMGETGMKFQPDGKGAMKQKPGTFKDDPKDHYKGYREKKVQDRMAKGIPRRSAQEFDETSMGGTVAGGIAPAAGQKTFAEASSGSHEAGWKAAGKAVHAIMKKRGYAGSKTEQGYMWTKQTPKGTAFVDIDFDERDPDTARWGEGELKGAKNKSYYQSGNDNVSDLAQVIGQLFANVKIGQPAMDEADEDGKKDQPGFGKKKPDDDGDGVPDWADKKPGSDDNEESDDDSEDDDSEEDDDNGDKELKLMKSRAGIADKDDSDDDSEDDDSEDDDSDDKPKKGKKPDFGKSDDSESDDDSDDKDDSDDADDSEDAKESKDESADKPKKSGGMKVGTGVYESAFNKSLKSQLRESINMNTSQDSDGKKSVTVTASDEDADKLGELLKMAGLFSSEGYSSVCQNCGGIHEANACGADHVDEDLANSPDEMYTDADYMTQTLSGGLNGPKTTGQTTGAVINRQDSRQGVVAEADKITEQAKTRLWNMYKTVK
jgi:hypothetical protein